MSQSASMFGQPTDAVPEEQFAAASPAAVADEASLNIEGSGAQSITVNLVGKKYRVKPPKAALALKLAVRAKQAEESPDLMAVAIDEWVDRAFSHEDAQDVKYRMYESEDDDLDLPHVMQLMEALIEKVTDNPSS